MQVFKKLKFFYYLLLEQLFVWIFKKCNNSDMCSKKNLSSLVGIKQDEKAYIPFITRGLTSN